MGEIVDGVVKAYGRQLNAESLIKIRRYLEILSSTGKKHDLTECGLAYLEQLHNPDPRFTGC
jgi:hypothetical protein